MTWARAGRPRLGRRGWKAAFFVTAAVAIVGAAGWALLGSRFLVVRTVRVTGTGPMVSAARVLAAARIPAGLPLIRVDGAAVARRVEQIRQVESAQVSTNWPSTVVIAVRLRTPVFAVAEPAGYYLIDRFGVVLLQARHHRGLPLLTVPIPSQGTGALRGSAAVRAAAAVLRELPRQIARRVTAVTAAGPSDVTVRLVGGTVIVWGDAGRAAQKSAELAALMRTHARLYDVSGTGTAVTRG